MQPMPENGQMHRRQSFIKLHSYREQQLTVGTSPSQQSFFPTISNEMNQIEQAKMPFY